MYDITEENIDLILSNYINQNYTRISGISLFLAINILDKYTNDDIQDTCIDFITSDTVFSNEELNRLVRNSIVNKIDLLILNLGIELVPGVSLLLKSSIIIGISNLLTEDNVPVLAGIIETNISPLDVLVTAIPLVSTVTLVQTTSSISSVSLELVKRISKVIANTDVNDEYEYPSIDIEKAEKNLKILSKFYSTYSILAVDVLCSGKEIGLNFEEYIEDLKDNPHESEEGRYLAVLSLLLISDNGSVLPLVVFEAVADRIFLERNDIVRCASFISKTMVSISIENKNAQLNFERIERARK